MDEQLTLVKDLGSTWEWCLSQDPVRPHIPNWRRVASNREYYLLNVEREVLAVTCVAYLDVVPAVEDELFVDSDKLRVACFYTVWSNATGYGRRVINRALRHISLVRPYVNTACTLSPKTKMARRFHIANGATLFRENELTDNFVYDISSL